MSCPTCKGEDHSRSSSKKCKAYKPPIRKRKLDETKQYEVYTIKHGLNKFFSPLLKKEVRTKLKQRIDEDVRVISRLMIETSYLVCIFYKYYHDHMPENRFDKLNVEHFTYVLKGSKRFKIEDPLNFISDYMSDIRKAPPYDGKRTTYIIQEACGQYTTNFNNNITMHMFRRIKKFVKLLKIEEDSKKIHDICYNYYYNNDTTLSNEITKTLDPYKLRADLVKKNPMQYLPFMFDLQALECTKGVRSCKVFPIYKQSVKHITYTTMGLYELLSSIGEEISSAKKFRDNAMAYWRRYFNVSWKTKMFGCSFSTDGVSVSISMDRLVASDIKLPLEKKAKMTESYNRVIAVDPGAKTPIVTCDLSFKYRMLSKGRVNFESGGYIRRNKLNKWTHRVEETIRNDIGDDETILSFKNENYMTTVKFKLKHFDNKQKCYERKNVVRLNFDAYIRKQRTVHRIIREFFVDKEVDGKILILYGNGCRFMNRAHFRGHPKFFHDKIIKYVQLYYKRHLTLELVDESYTTKTCSMCQQMDDFRVSTGGHRYVYCSKCRRGTHRDKNAAKNILLKNWLHKQ